MKLSESEISEFCHLYGPNSIWLNIISKIESIKDMDTFLGRFKCSTRSCLAFVKNFKKIYSYFWDYQDMDRRA